MSAAFFILIFLEALVRTAWWWMRLILKGTRCHTVLIILYTSVVLQFWADGHSYVHPVSLPHPHPFFQYYSAPNCSLMSSVLVKFMYDIWYQCIIVLLKICCKAIVSWRYLLFAFRIGTAVKSGVITRLVLSFLLFGIATCKDIFSPPKSMSFSLVPEYYSNKCSIIFALFEIRWTYMRSQTHFWNCYF